MLFIFPCVAGPPDPRRAATAGRCRYGSLLDVDVPAQRGSSGRGLVGGDNNVLVSDSGYSRPYSAHGEERDPDRLPRTAEAEGARVLEAVVEAVARCLRSILMTMFIAGVVPLSSRPAAPMKCRRWAFVFAGCSGD